MVDLATIGFKWLVDTNLGVWRVVWSGGWRERGCLELLVDGMYG